MSDLVEQGEGALLLEYINGDVCGEGTRSMVHIHFTCGAGAGTVRSVVGGLRCRGSLSLFLFLTQALDMISVRVYLKDLGRRLINFKGPHVTSSWKI
jgi:hypothetical protein